MEKHGTFHCPHCNSVNVIEVSSEEVEMPQNELIKIGGQNVGGSFFCRSCRSTFTRVTGSPTSSENESDD